MVASKNVEIGGIAVTLSEHVPKGNPDALFKSIFATKNDLEWWGLRAQLRSPTNMQWFGTGGKEDSHNCEAAIVRPMLRVESESKSQPTPVIIWLESHGYFSGDGVYMSVVRANLFDKSGKLIATEPGPSEKPVVYYEKQMAGFLSQPEVVASFNGVFVELVPQLA